MKVVRCCHINYILRRDKNAITASIYVECENMLEEGAETDGDITDKHDMIISRDMSLPLHWIS